MNILTGVYSGNSLSGDFLDEIICNGVNLDYEAYIEENGEDSADDYMESGDTYLLGFKKDENGLWDVDTDAEISAKYNSNENTVQIVHSRYVLTDARMCSPCYPNQGDADSIGGGVVCYAVDSENVNEYDENAVKISGMVKHISELQEESA